MLQLSKKFGAMFMAFGPELIVVPNTKLYQVLKDGDLNSANPLSQGSNKTNGSPLIFLKVADEIDTLFL